MYKKNLAYLAMVSLKYFFNMDHELVAQMFIIMLLGISCFRYSVLIMVNTFVSLMQHTKGHIMMLKGYLKRGEGEKIPITADVPFKAELKFRNRFEWHF